MAVIVSSTEDLSPRSQAKRKEILEVAAELFSERGFEKTSLKTLAVEAQVSTSTIYTYFDDKLDLLEQVIRTRLDALLEGAAAEVGDSTDPIEGLARGVRLINRRIAGDPMIARILTYQRHVVGRGLRDHVDGVVARLDEMATRTLRRAIAVGDLPCDDPVALCAVMRLYMQGWLLSSLKGTEEISERRATEALLALVQAAAGRGAGPSGA